MGTKVKGARTWSNIELALTIIFLTMSAYVAIDSQITGLTVFTDQAEVDLSIKDAFGAEVLADVEIIDARQVKAFVTGTTQTIDKGKYEIRIKPKTHPVKEIVIEDADIQETIKEIIKLDDVEEKGDLSEFAQVYAIDPGLNFTSATVTVTAKGTELYKCKDWNFSTQSCYGNWALFKTGLVPGQVYSFTLTPEDAGFGETINITKATHLDENRSFISEIYEQVKALDGVWSDPIYENEYVRVTFEQYLTAENDITVYARNNQSLNTSIDVYHYNSSTLITSFPFITTEDYYKVLLTGMNGSHDTFDLKIVNSDNMTAYLEFDHIVDPSGPSAGDPGLVSYGEGSITTPRYRTWNGTEFSTEASAATAAATIQWIVVRASPTDANEKVMGLVSSDNNLYIQTWNGSTWTANWSTSLGTSTTRRFDIAYEQNSGDALVVFHTGGTTLQYRKRVAGTWDSTNQNTGISHSSVLWVKIEPKPGSDDIFGLSSDNAIFDIKGWRWNGTSNTFPTGNQQFTAALAAPDGTTEEPFDIALESDSGEVFAIYGHFDLGGVRYTRYTTSWQTEQVADSAAVIPTWLKAAYDPQSTSDDIAIIWHDADANGLEFAAWNGTTWTTTTALTPRSTAERGLDVAFEKDTGKAVFIFDQSTPGNQMSWRTWTASGGFSTVTSETGTTGNINFMQLRADPNSNDMMALYADVNGDLFHREWNGSSWSALGTALEDLLSINSGREPFMFAWQLADGTPPSVTNVKPTAGSNFTQGDSVPINATVTDNVQVDTVIAQIAMPNGTVTNQTMTNVSSLYSTNFNTTLNHPTGQYNITFIANDASGLVNSTETTFFNLQIGNLPPTTPTNIQCDGSNNCNITVDASVQLNASGSTDQDGDVITFTLEALFDKGTTVQDGTDVNKAIEVEAGGPVDFQDFESDQISPFGNWTATGGTCDWTADQAGTPTGGTGPNHDNTIGNASGYYIYVETSSSACQGADIDAILESNNFTAGSVNTTVSFYYHMFGANTGTLALDVYNGSWNDDVFNVSGQQHTAEADAYTKQTVDLSSFSGIIKVRLRYDDVTGFGGDAALDDLNITTESAGVNESNTSYTTYQDVDAEHDSVSSVEVKVEVDSYDPRASVDQSTAKPDLELDIYNGSEFVTIGVFNLPSTYTGSGLQTNNENFTLITTDSAITTAWKTVANQDLRIRGRFMDNNGSIADEINYTNVYVTILETDWRNIGNHTENTTFTWITALLIQQTNIDLRARAIDIDGTNTYSSYFTKGANITIQRDQPPTVSIINPQNITYATQTGLALDFTASDDFGVSACWYSVDSGSNVSLPGCANTTFNVGSDGSHDITVYANDTIGQVGSAKQDFSVDIAAPTYSAIIESPADPATYAPGGSYQFNVTWTDNLAVDTVILQFDGVNYTDLTNVGNVYTRIFTDLAAGTYNYRWFANDTAGNQNDTGTLTYTINQAADTVNLYLNGIQGNLTINYSQSNATATSTSRTEQLFRDGVSVSNPEIASLVAGTYAYRANSSGNQNYTASSGVTYYLTVNKAASEVNLLLDGTDGNLTVEVGSSVNFSGFRLAGEADIRLYRDGVLINAGSPFISNLSTFNSLGVFNITVSHESTQNFTPSSETHYVIVQDTVAPQYSNILESPADPATYAKNQAYRFNVTWTEPRIDAVLIEHNFTGPLANSSVSNVSSEFFADFTDLPIGSYQWRSFANDTSGRSNVTPIQTYTVNQAASAVNLTLDGTDGNLTVSPGSTVNLSGFKLAGEANVKLYRNGALINTGSSFISNLSTFNSLGVFNITVSYDATQNFTGSSETHFVIVQDVVAPQYSNILESPVDPATYSKGASYRFNVTWSDDVALNLVSIEHDFTGPLTNSSMSNVSGEFFADFTDLPAGDYQWRSFANDTSDNRNVTPVQTYTVNKAASAVNLNLDGTDGNISVGLGSTVNLSGFRIAGESNISLYRDGVLLEEGSPFISALSTFNSLGNFNITVSYAATQNFSGSFETHYVIVADNETPVYSNILESPTDPATYSKGASYRFNVTWTDNFAMATVTIEHNFTGTLTNSSMSNLSTEFFADFTDLSAGSYQWRSFASDVFGNRNSTPVQTYSINKVASAVNLTLDGTDGNLTVEAGSAVNLSGFRLAGEAGIRLYRADALINIGAPFISNISTFNSLGAFNITLSHEDTQNFTSSSETHYVNVQDTTPPAVFDPRPAPASAFTIGNEIEIAANVTDTLIDDVLANITLPNVTLVRINLALVSGTDKFNTSFTIPSLVGQYNVTFIANDTIGNVNTSETTFFVAQSQTPVINATSVFPPVAAVTENITLSANVTDDIGVDTCWANVTIPNGTQIFVADVCTPSIFTAPNVTGVYNVTFYANDSEGNLATSVGDPFEIGPLIVWTANVVDDTLSGINLTFSIFFAGTELEADIGVNGTVSRDLSDFLYDLQFTAYEDTLTVTIRDVNITIDNNRTLGLDRITTNPDFLVLYGLDSGNYTFSNSTIIISYAGTGFSDEDNLNVQVCEVWNFTSLVCSSGFVDLDAVQDTAADTFTFNRTSFSSFGIVETIPAAPPVSGVGGGGGGYRAPITCISEWDCGEWSACRFYTQTRICTDINNCTTPTEQPETSRECPREPIVVPPPVILPPEEIPPEVIEELPPAPLEELPLPPAPECRLLGFNLGRFILCWYVWIIFYVVLAYTLPLLIFRIVKKVTKQHMLYYHFLTVMVLFLPILGIFMDTPLNWVVAVIAQIVLALHLISHFRKRKHQITEMEYIERRIRESRRHLGKDAVKLGKKVRQAGARWVRQVEREANKYTRNLFKVFRKKPPRKELNITQEILDGMKKRVDQVVHQKGRKRAHVVNEIVEGMKKQVDMAVHKGRKRPGVMHELLEGMKKHLDEIAHKEGKHHHISVIKEISEGMKKHLDEVVKEEKKVTGVMHHMTEGMKKRLHEVTHTKKKRSRP